MEEHILIVDDERELADLIEVYLANDGYIVHKFYNGTDALLCLKDTPIDLAVLDVMLPDIDGFTLCRKIREKFYFPVIMLIGVDDDGMVTVNDPNSRVNSEKTWGVETLMEQTKNLWGYNW